MTEFTRPQGRRYRSTGLYAVLSIAALFPAADLAAQQSGPVKVPVARLNVDTASTLQAPLVLHGGVASPQAPVNGFQLLRDAGLTSGTFRRTTRMYESDVVLAGHLRDAKSAGLDTWLTVVGTPEDLQTTGSGTTYQTWSIPPFARTVPSDLGEWSDRVIDRLDAVYNQFGQLPDYVEIWNEVDRVESWEGSLQDYLELYSVTAAKIRAAYPQIKIGGPGLAGQFSTMEGTESVLDALARHCDQYSLPLDFLSWHHYTEANELDLTGVVDRLHALVASLGMQPVELVISEWNIWPNAHHDPIHFDNARAASQLGGFLTTALYAGLDRSMFFQMFDITVFNGDPMLDLQGAHMGMITTHGIKKPSAHVLSMVTRMMQEQLLVATHEPDEYGVRVLASRTQDRIRLLVTHDEVQPKWLWVEKCRMNGFLGGELFDRVMAAANQVGVANPTAEQLAATGLVTLYEAQFSLATLAEAKRLEAAKGQTREVRIQLDNLTAAELEHGRFGRVVVFDSVHNNPTLNVSQIQADLQEAEDLAFTLAFDDTADFLRKSYGFQVTGPVLQQTGIEEWLTANGGNGNQIFNAQVIFKEALVSRRMERWAEWDTHPATSLKVSDAKTLGFRFVRETNEIVLQMEPDSVTFLELEM